MALMLCPFFFCPGLTFKTFGQELLTWRISPRIVSLSTCRDYGRKKKEDESED